MISPLFYRKSRFIWIFPTACMETLYQKTKIVSRAKNINSTDERKKQKFFFKEEKGAEGQKQARKRRR